MNLDQLYFSAAFYISFCSIIIFIYLLCSSDEGKNSISQKWQKLLFKVFITISIISCIFFAYKDNYENGGYKNIAKITSHTCIKNNRIETDCEFIGVVTYRPYMRELKITTTPLYPILNCPNYYSKNCVQELIFVDKKSVKSLKKLQ